MHRSLACLLAAVLLVAACAPGGDANPTSALSSAAPASSVPVLGEPIGGIECDRGGHDDAYHIHSFLRVKVDSRLVVPPANIGITDTCMYWVHTHDTDGVIHVEAPAEVEATLGHFLAIWTATYPDDPTLAAAQDAVRAGAVTVDGVRPVAGEGGYGGDPRTLALTDGAAFVLGE